MEWSIYGKRKRQKETETKSVRDTLREKRS